MPAILTTLGEAARAGIEIKAICRKPECRYSQKINLAEVVQHVGGIQPLVPVKWQKHFSERMRCPACKTLGMYIWVDLPSEGHPLYPLTSSAFRVLEWSQTGRIDRELAVVHTLPVAQAAYRAARELYHTSHITLQQGARVISDSWEDQKAP